MSIKSVAALSLTLLLVVLIIMGIDWSHDFGGALDFFQRAQRAFHDRLATDMHAIKDTGSWLPGFALIAIGFVYGVFHAVGPGHGKLIVTSYMLAEKSSLRRGIIIVVLSSLLQGLVAIAVVLGLFYLLGLARAETEHAALLLEGISFVLIGIMGLRLVLRGTREAVAILRPLLVHAHHDHEHHEHHHNHAHDHQHHDECGCGHAHMPSADEVAKARSLWSLALMVLSIGIRPCSGAIILLLFACLIGVVIPGVIATLAMSAGTALTTAALAVLAVTSKNWVLKRMKSSNKALAVTHAALGIGGGLLVATIGIFFALVAIQSEWQMPKSGADTNSAATMHLPQR